MTVEVLTVEIPATTLTLITEAQANKLNAAMDACDQVERPEDIKELMLGLSKLLKDLEKQRTTATKPMRTALSDLKAMVDEATEAPKLILSALKEELAEIAKAQEEARRKAAKEAEENARKAQEQREKGGPVRLDMSDKDADSPSVKVSTRKHYSINIKDVDQIPRGFMVPDERAILAALKLGHEVPGVELITEERVSAR